MTSLGFGVSGPHGQGWFSEKKLTRLIAQAVDGGVRDFDAAPFYGEAEARLGRALRATRAAGVIVSTKTGTRREGGRVVKDFSQGAIRADAEASLKRLHRDALDMLYLHGPAVNEIDAALPALLALKAEGKVKAIGVCGEGAPLDHALSTGFDAIMGAYNIIDRRHAGIFARARACGVQTVAIAPLAQGAFANPKAPWTLSGLWRLARTAIRRKPPEDLVEKARAALLDIEGLPASGAALAFVLQGGLASLAITTTTNSAHLAETLAAARHPVSEALIARLTALALDPAEGQS
ncbi:MAG: aldo/keto reductase [Parvularculaceae bacterium]|nr:aldo/keto reductase [Parvularculaceae bacterium]